MAISTPRQVIESGTEGWDKNYKSGQDFRFTSDNSIDRIVALSGHRSIAAICIDIGCGTGHLARELWQRGFDVKAFDLSKIAVQMAKSRTRTNIEIDYQVLDAALGWDPVDSLASLAICKLVLPFIQNKPMLYRNVQRALRSDGLLVVVLPEQTPTINKSLTISEGELSELLSWFPLKKEWIDQGLWYMVLCNRLP
jgi:2-polyprenyl-3-methyl-5-hydroxy-6-metoxy-1,4-benzoquinol methylase